MAQNTFPDLLAQDPNGLALGQYLNNFRDAVLSSHIGPTRPAYATPGMIWVQDNNGTLTSFVFDGQSDHQVIVPGLDGAGGVLKFFGTGAVLPAADIGPIWHADFNSIMTWQVFDANGADYTGYASVNIGDPFHKGQPTARKGHLKLNASSISAGAYPALVGWAKHHGFWVPVANWNASAWQFGDNGDGTFRLPDIRADWFRSWDDGRGADAGRVFGTAQGDAMRNLTGGHNGLQYPTYANGIFTLGGASGNKSPGVDLSGRIVSFDASRQVPTASEFRTRNVAFSVQIKF